MSTPSPIVSGYTKISACAVKHTQRRPSDTPLRECARWQSTTGCGQLQIQRVELQMLQSGQDEIWAIICWLAFQYTIRGV